MPRIFVLGLAALSATPALAASNVPFDPLVITATRLEERPVDSPLHLSVVTWRDLRARGARDLGAALERLPGIDISPGGDAGPAGAVPEFWGLREGDAVLIMVDGIPWGRPFLPSYETVDVESAERIEVIRGAAPAAYGATSFTGLIHVVRRDPARVRPMLQASAGSYGSYGARAETALGSRGSAGALAVHAERTGFADSRAESLRKGASWRAARGADGGTFKIALDAILLRQKPKSPHVVGAAGLDPRPPLDANHNPSDARLEEDRYTFSGSFERPVSWGSLNARLALASSRQNNLRAFLEDANANPPEAEGYVQDLEQDYVYADINARFEPGPGATLVFGLDHLRGRGRASGQSFEYTVALSGADAPHSSAATLDQDHRVDERRDFSGAYALAERDLHPRLKAQAGFRLSRVQVVREKRDTAIAAQASSFSAGDLDDTRGSGMAGARFKAWESANAVANVFANYRWTFEPGDADFTFGGDGAVLGSETGESWEGGIKGAAFDGRFDAALTLFRMDFRNAVVSTRRNGLPAKVNAGHTRSAGAEAALAGRFGGAGNWRAGAAYHDSTFVDFEVVSNNQVANLGGKRLESSPRWLATAGADWAPEERGPLASLNVRYVGERFLDRANTVGAKAFVTFGAGVGWRRAGFEVRLDADNLSDQRPATTETEIGDDQFYRLPARRFGVTVRWEF